MSEQKELSIRVLISGQHRTVTLPFEVADKIDRVSAAFGFKDRAEWCQALLEGISKFAPEKKRFMKQTVLNEIEAIALALDTDGDKSITCRDVARRYLVAGIKPIDVAKMTNSGKTCIYDMASKMKSEELAPVAPDTLAAKEELDESLATLNLAKEMHKAMNDGATWESLTPVQRIMWVDAAVTEIASERFEFPDVLRAIKDKPVKTMATRKAWGDRKTFIFTHDGELRLSRPDVAVVWKPTGEDLLANDWFFL